MRITTSASAFIRHLMAGAAMAIAMIGGAAPVRAETILFVGNSFTFAALSPVWHYRGASVTDLNGEGVGGVPALFKLFSDEAGLHYQVSLETSPGKDLQWHIDNKTSVLDHAYDHVILQSYSTLDAKNPGDPTSLIRAAAILAKMFHDRNPGVDIRLDSTWSRADLTYRPGGHWFGKPISAMQSDLRAGYEKAAAASPLIGGVVQVGAAWNRAMETGFAVANPYEAIPFGKVDLWAYDNYHASTFGYYIEALMIFGAVTGKDPRSLGPAETAARELGVSPAQATAMQQIAYDELAAPPRSR